MSCTFQSAFQRQLFITTFSGTYKNQENVTTDVLSVRGEMIILQSFVSCDLFSPGVFNPVLAKFSGFLFFCFSQHYILDQVVCYEALKYL